MEKRSRNRFYKKEITAIMLIAIVVKTAIQIRKKEKKTRISLLIKILESEQQ